jgi:hypothetical protein
MLNEIKIQGCKVNKIAVGNDAEIWKKTSKNEDFDPFL